MKYKSKADKKYIAFLLSLLLAGSSACGKSQTPRSEEILSGSYVKEDIEQPESNADDQRDEAVEEPEDVEEVKEDVQAVWGTEIDWADFSERVKDKAERLIQNESLSLDSLRIAIMDGGELVLSESFGVFDRQTKEPVSEKTLYGVGSASKVIATAAVMQLVEQGLVELDAPITEYLPALHMQDPRYQQITVRMLMNHSSGLEGNTSADAWRLGAFEDRAQLDEFLDILNGQTLKSDPGAYGVYCNDGFTLLELICEAVSGESYEAYLHNHVTGPLQMSHTYSPMDSFGHEQLVKTYFGSFSNAVPALTVDAGFGGMYSTAEDLCRFGQTFTNLGSVALNAESVEQMAAQEYQNGVWYEDGASITNYGLGWDAVDLYPFDELGVKAVTKNGDVVLSGSQLLVLPEYNLVAAITGSGGSTSVGRPFLISVMLDILKEKDLINAVPEKPELSAAYEDVPESMQKYAGIYVRTSGRSKISFSGDHLIRTSMSDGSESVYQYDGKGHFNDGETIELWFVEKDGKQYLAQRTWDNSIGEIDLPDVSFQGIKVEDGELSGSVKSAWQNRNGKTYLLVSEPADSMGYLYPIFGLALPSYKVTVNVDLDSSSFWRGMRITDENTAVNAADVPANGSTNAVSVKFNGEYASFSNGTVYRSADSFSMLDSVAAVNGSDEALWYRTGDARELSYDIPDGCSIDVYDESLKLTDSTLLSGSNTIKTSDDGYIVFVGNGVFSLLS